MKFSGEPEKGENDGRIKAMYDMWWSNKTVFCLQSTNSIFGNGQMSEMQERISIAYRKIKDMEIKSDQNIEFYGQRSRKGMEYIGIKLKFNDKTDIKRKVRRVAQ